MRSGVSYTTVRRAAQGEQSLSLQMTIMIGDLIFDRTKLKEIISTHFPEFSKVAFNNYWQQPENEAYYDFVTSKEHFPILMLASNEGGTTREEILLTFGIKAELPTDQLLESGLLKEINGRINLCQNSVGVTSKKIARSNIEIMLDLCNPQNESINDASQAFTYTQGLNVEGVRAACAILREADEKLYKLLSDSKYHGNVLWFSGILSNVLINGEKLK